MGVCPRYPLYLLAIIAILTTTHIVCKKGVSLPHVPEQSPTTLFPPWAIFRPAVAMSNFFQSAATATTPPNTQIWGMATAYFKSEVLYALTYNGIIDELESAKSMGGLTCEEVSARLQLKEHSVCIFMTAGYRLGLFEKSLKGSYVLTATGRLVVSGAEGSMRDIVLMMNEEFKPAWRAAGKQSMHSGNSGFMEAYGEETFSWHRRHPEKDKQFSGAMKSLAYAATGAALLDWDLPSQGVFCDIGASKGHDVATILQHYPEMTGVILDQPAIIDLSKGFLEAQQLSDRVTPIAGDFFQPLPKEMEKCDVFFLKYILHSWSDEASVQILSQIKRVAKPGAKIGVMEQVQETTNLEGMELSKALMSVNMLASCPWGAKERSVTEYQQLFDEAGYNRTATVVPLRGILSILEVQL